MSMEVPLMCLQNAEVDCVLHEYLPYKMIVNVFGWSPHVNEDTSHVATECRKLL